MVEPSARLKIYPSRDLAGDQTSCLTLRSPEIGGGSVLRRLPHDHDVSLGVIHGPRSHSCVGW